MEKQREEMRRRASKERQKRYFRKRLITTLGLLLVITGVGVTAAAVAANKKKEKQKNSKDGVVETVADPAVNETPEQKEQPNQKEETKEPEAASWETVLAEANLLAEMYDYDGAMEKIKGFSGYESVGELTGAISDYEARKAECVPVDISTIPHVFYHSLVVDPGKAFANQETDPQAVGNNQWMTTIDEFNKITQIMYDQGYVLVDLKDIAQETVDDSGATHYTEGAIMIPPGKKAYVMSLDDLSYYHSYDGYGFASKMVLDENGKPKCEYIQDDSGQF